MVKSISPPQNIGGSAGITATAAAITEVNAPLNVGGNITFAASSTFSLQNSLTAGGTIALSTTAGSILQGAAHGLLAASGSLALDAPGAIGALAQPIQIEGIGGFTPSSVVIGSNTAPSAAYLNGQGILTLGNVAIGNGNLAASAQNAITVAPSAILSAGSGTISLSADVLYDGVTGNTNTGVLTISSGAVVDSTSAITLRGYNITIATGADPAVVGGPSAAVPTAGGVVLRSSQASDPMSIGNGTTSVAGVNLTNAELAQIFTTAAGTITFGDTSQTGNIAFHTATPVTTAGASIVVQQSPSGGGAIVLDDQNTGAALNGNGGTITLSAGTGGIVAATANNAFPEIATAGVVDLDTNGAIGSAANRIQFNPASRPANVIVGANSQPTAVYLDGLTSLANSVVTVSAPIVNPGGTLTVKLQIQDVYGNNETTGGRTVLFQLGNGVGGGTFGTVTDDGNGAYTASFTAGASGANTVTATINGQAITSTPVSFDVAPTVTSLTVSTATITDATVATGTFTVNVDYSEPMNTAAGGHAHHRLYAHGRLNPVVRVRELERGRYRLHGGLRRRQGRDKRFEHCRRRERGPGPRGSNPGRFQSERRLRHRHCGPEYRLGNAERHEHHRRPSRHGNIQRRGGLQRSDEDFGHSADGVHACRQLDVDIQFGKLERRQHDLHRDLQRRQFRRQHFPSGRHDHQRAKPRRQRSSPRVVQSKRRLRDRHPQSGRASLPWTPTTTLITDATVGASTFKLALQYSVAMKTTPTFAPLIAFTPTVGTTLTFVSGSWNTAATTYTAVYTVANANVSVPAVAVTVTGARSTAGNAQLPFGPTNVFAIDTVSPTVTSITPSAAVISDALAGAGTFKLAIQYSGAMSTATAPTIAFTPAIASTLSFKTGSWDATHTLYTASFNVAEAAVNVSAVAVAVSAAKSADGDLQVAKSQAAVFAVDTVSPTVTAITPGAANITEALVGSGTFTLAVTYSGAMNAGVVPAITFNPGLAATLTFNSGSWNTLHTVYTATYNVADSGVSSSGIAVTVTGGHNADSNLQIVKTILNVFKIDTLHPSVIALTPSVPMVTRTTTTFSMAIQFGTQMSTATTPVITFSSAVGATFTPSHTSSWLGLGTVYNAVYTVSIINSLAGVDVPGVTVTVAGAKNVDANLQTSFTKNNAFALDTTIPAVTSITPSVPVITDAQRGSATFTVAVQYNEVMLTTVAPTIAFSTGVASTLTFVSASWDATHTLYTAAYNVADAGVSVPGVGITVSGARNVDGDAQASTTATAAFNIDTANPTVISIMPNASIITNALTGSGTFTLAVLYSGAMNPAVVPTISFSPALSSTLTFASGSWNPAHTIYTAAYNIASSGVSVAAVSVTVKDAQNADGNLQVAKVQAAAFSIDTTTPSVIFITPSLGVITRTQPGTGAFTLTIQFNEAMSTAVAPTIAFSPTISSALTFTSGAWDKATHRIYTANYKVATTLGVSAPDVAVTVSGAKSADGNTQAPINQDQVFAVDTVIPTVTAITPSAAVVNTTQVGASTFWLSVAYSGPMNPGSAPTIAFSTPVSTVLTLASGSWNAANTVYTAYYNVAAASTKITGIGVTASGATNADGNVQTSAPQTAVFSIDTVNPTVVSVTPSVATITDAQVGANGFSLSVQFSTAMNTSIHPTINLDPDVTSTLTFFSGSWDATDTIFTATYAVADAGVTVAGVQATISDAQSAAGNLVVPFDQPGAFAISTL